MFSRKITKLQKSPNFEVFYRIFAQRKLGVVATSIIVSINFFQLNIYLFQSFKRLTGNTDSIVDILNDVTQYVYMSNLVNYGTVIYIIVRTIVFVLTLGYFVLYIIMRKLVKKGRSMKTVERIFMLLNTYYTMILLLPIMDTLFGEIFCDERVLEPMGVHCLEGTHIFIFVLSVISLIVAVYMAVITVFYSMNGIYDKKNYLSGENKIYEAMITFIRILVTLLMSNNSLTDSFRKLYLSINLICSLAMIIYFIIFYPYNKTFIEKFTLMWLTIYLAQSVSMIIYVAQGNETLAEGDKAPEMTLSIGYSLLLLMAVGIPAVSMLYNKLKIRLIMKDSHSSIEELLRKIQNILQLKNKGANTIEEVVYRGLIAKHFAICNDLRCFCKKKELYDAKKKKDFEVEKWHQNKPLILKSYVKMLFEKEVDKGELDPHLLISYAEFLFEKYRNTHLALFQLMKLTNSNKFLYPHHRYRIFKLKYRIGDYINTKNTEALEKQLEIENVLFVEEQFDRVLDGMQKIITSSIHFWSYLQNKEIDLDRLRDYAAKMNEYLENTNDMWTPLKPYLYKQKRLMYYYNWFLKDFLQKKIILSEEEADDLFDEDTYSVHSNDFLNLIKNDNIVFQDDSAIIHMSGNYTDLGKIIKTNKATAKIFGYSKDDLKNAYVNELMPSMIAQKHNSYLEAFIKTGKSKLLYSQKKTFAKDKQGFIMPIWIIVKQMNHLEGQVEYVGLLKPLTEKKDEQSYYILLNNFGEISGISKNLQDVLFLPENFFQKNPVNIVLLAPKLIKYFYFGRVLQDEKEIEREVEKRLADSVILTGIDSSIGTTNGWGNARTKLRELSTQLVTLHTMAPQIDKKKGISPFMGSIGKKNMLREFLELDQLEENLFDGEFEGSGLAKEEEPFDFNAEENQVEFTLRVPKNLDKLVQEFDNLKSRQAELLNNQQLLIEAVQTKALHKAAAHEKSNTPFPKSSLMKSKLVSHMTHSKHAFDAYITALKLIATRIAKKSSNDVFRIKGTVITDHYGPENDSIKYIKITEIQNKSSKFNGSGINQDNSLLRSGSTDRSLTEDEEHTLARKKTLTKNKPSIFKHAKEEEENDVDEKGDNNDESQALKEGDPDLKRKNTVVSKKSEKKSEKKSDAGESARQVIINEFKNSIAMQYQSIYHKEDNLLIDKNFQRLNNVKWFIQFLFFIMIPINITVYLVGANYTFAELESCISDVFMNEGLKNDYMKAHNAMITLILNDRGNYSTVSVVSPVRVSEVMNHQTTYIDEAYENILLSNSLKEWINILYKFTPEISDKTEVHYDGSLADLIMETENSLQKMANSLSQVESYSQAQFVGTDTELQFYRRNSFEKINVFLSQVSQKIFDELEKRFELTINLSITILIIESALFVFSLIAILRLIVIVIKSLREILETFTAIDNQQVRETENYYHRLMSFFRSSTQLAVSDYESKMHKKHTASSAKDQGTRYTKKTKTIINPEKFMRQDTVRILGFYILSVVLFCGLALFFHLFIVTYIEDIKKSTADAETFVQLNSVHISALVAVKELIYSKDDYETYVYPYLTNVLLRLENTLDTSVYKSDLDWVSFTKSLYEGTPCDTYRTLFFGSDTVKYQECKTFALEKLNAGLSSFHGFFRDKMLDFLQLKTEGRFGELTMDLVYEFGQLISIINDVFMEEILDQWQSDTKSYVDGKQRALIIMLVGVSVCNLLVFFIAEKGVVGTLRERFLFYRKIYNKFMLNEALMREKKIIATLKKYKLLNK